MQYQSKPLNIDNLYYDIQVLYLPEKNFVRTKTDSCSKCETAEEARGNKLINCNNSEGDSKVSITKILDV